MKKLFSSILITLGLITMLNASNYTVRPELKSKIDSKKMGRI